jgi:hypothetical protein
VQGKRAEAQREMEAAQELGHSTQNRYLRLQFELISGRVSLASDDPQTSTRLLQQVATDAHRHGFVGLELADDLALAQLANKTRHVSQAQIDLGFLNSYTSFLLAVWHKDHTVWPIEVLDTHPEEFSFVSHSLYGHMR